MKYLFFILMLTSCTKTYTSSNCFIKETSDGFLGLKISKTYSEGYYQVSVLNKNNNGIFLMKTDDLKKLEEIQCNVLEEYMQDFYNIKGIK